MAEAIKKFSPVRMSGKTEEAALQQALLLTGASRDEVEVEILDQSESRVTVRVSPRSSESARSEPAPAATEPAPAATEPVSVVAVAEPEADEDPLTDMNLTNGTDESESTMDDADDEAESVKALEDVEDSDAAMDGEEDEEDEAPEDTEPEDVEIAPRAAPVRMAPVDDAARERARALAQDVLDHMGLEGQAQLAPLDENEGRANVNLVIEGADVGILIGKHGATLQAFQYVINLMLNNGSEGQDGTRVVVDAGGYRARRAGALEQIAQEAAARAKRDRRSVRLEPMPAYERRLVHMALQNDGTVSTSSEGAEPMRHVVITPAGSEGRSGGRGGYGGERSYSEGRPGEGRPGEERPSEGRPYNAGRSRGGFGGFNGRSGPSGGQSGGPRRYGRGR